jgi:hypothetical protein
MLEDTSVEHDYGEGIDQYRKYYVHHYENPLPNIPISALPSVSSFFERAAYGVSCSV